MPEKNVSLEVDKPAQESNDSGRSQPEQAYNYPHSTDHPPVAPIPDEGDHDVKSYGGAPEGGT